MSVDQVVYTMPALNRAQRRGHKARSDFKQQHATKAVIRAMLMQKKAN